MEESQLLPLFRPDQLRRGLILITERMKTDIVPHVAHQKLRHAAPDARKPAATCRAPTSANPQFRPRKRSGSVIPTKRSSPSGSAPQCRCTMPNSQLCPRLSKCSSSTAALRPVRACSADFNVSESRVTGKSTGGNSRLSTSGSADAGSTAADRSMNPSVRASALNPRSTGWRMPPARRRRSPF